LDALFRSKKKRKEKGKRKKEKGKKKKKKNRKKGEFRAGLYPPEIESRNTTPHAINDL
jgi:ribosomal protein L25 (general stress protein Ctc)